MLFLATKDVADTVQSGAEATAATRSASGSLEDQNEDSLWGQQVRKIHWAAVIVTAVQTV